MEPVNVNNSRGYTEMAMKVNKVRNAKANLYNHVGLISAVGALGLGLIGPGSALAFIPGGMAAAVATKSMLDSGRYILKNSAIKHKLKKIAKCVKKACGINIRPEYNYSTRQAGFVLLDMTGRVPITSFLTSENISEYLDSEQCAIVHDSIAREFAVFNSYRGLGEHAKTMREFKYRNSKQIGLDNITSAFDDVGGVLTNSELAGLCSGENLSHIEYQKFMREHKGESLWVLSGHLSTYLGGLTEMSIEDKNNILREFKKYFEKQGEEGIYEFEKLSEQLNLEEPEMKRIG